MGLRIGNALLMVSVRGEGRGGEGRGGEGRGGEGRGGERRGGERRERGEGRGRGGIRLKTGRDLYFNNERLYVITKQQGQYSIS